MKYHEQYTKSICLNQVLETTKLFTVAIWVMSSSGRIWYSRVNESEPGEIPECDVMSQVYRQDNWPMAFGIITMANTANDVRASWPSVNFTWTILTRLFNSRNITGYLFWLHLLPRCWFCFNQEIKNIEHVSY